MEKKTKLTLLIGCLGLPVLLVLICLGGAFMLPSKYEVTRSIVIDAPPQAIHPHIASFQAWEPWSPWVEDQPEMTMEYSGPPIGVGNTMTFHSPTDGDGTLVVTRSDPATGMAFDMTMGEFAINGEITLERNGEQTTVTWTDRGDLGNNPVYRLMGLAMDEMLGSYMERGLAGIKRELAEGPPATEAQPADDTEGE